MLNYPQINPIAFSLGTIKVHWYGLMYLFSFTIAWFLGFFRKNQPWTPVKTTDQLNDILFYGIIGVLIGLLIASDASEREARNIVSLTNPYWILRDIPSEILGKAFGRSSLAFIGILKLKNAKNDFNGHSIKSSFRRWRSFIHVNSCQKGTDGCINDQWN